MSTSSRGHYAGGASARYVLLGSAFFLTLFGLVMIYSASSITAAVREGSSTHYLVRQLLYIAVGVVCAAALSRFDYRRLRPLAQPVWWGAVGLLVATLIVGVRINGARRWFPLGITNIQPSELAKIACVLLVAAVAIEWQRGALSGERFAVRVAGITLAPAVLIMLQPDLGTTLTLVAAVGVVLFLAGIDWRWIAASIAAMGIVAAIAIAVEPFRIKRVIAFMDPFEHVRGNGWQTVQALLAFGTGGVDGVGLGLSRQKFFYLPEAHTDFILAIIGEEVGLIGTIAVVLGIGLFIWAGFKIAIGARDPFGRLVAGGLAGMLALQALLNMGAVTGMLPVTGKPLPFVSSGGSSMIVTMLCLGLILSVSEYGALAPRAVRTRPRNEAPRREGPDERRGNRGPRVPRPERGRTSRRRA